MIRSLSPELKSRLRSGVAIRSTTQCVEELVFNAVDAGATCIAIRVDLSCGQIQVVDNGCSVSKDQMVLLAERYNTSKCHKVSDLERLQYFGYRGEALASIRDMCQTLEIECRSKLSPQTFTCKFKRGVRQEIVESLTYRPCHGTTVTVYDLFHAFPVRQKCLNEVLELERLRQNLEATALIHPGISFTLRNDYTSDICLQTHKASTILDTFSHLFGKVKSKYLCSVQHQEDQFKVEGYISKETHSNKNLQFIYINKRIVLKTKLHKLLNDLLARSVIIKKKFYVESESKKARGENILRSPQAEKYGIYVMNISCPLSEYDVTFDPEKTLVEFIHWSSLLMCTEDAVLSFLRRENLLSQIDECVKEVEESRSIHLEDQNDTTKENIETVSGSSELTSARYADGISTDNFTDTLQSKTVRRPRKLPNNVSEAELFSTVQTDIFSKETLHMVEDRIVDLTQSPIPGTELENALIQMKEVTSTHETMIGDSEVTNSRTDIESVLSVSLMEWENSSPHTKGAVHIICPPESSESSEDTEESINQGLSANLVHRQHPTTSDSLRSRRDVSGDTSPDTSPHVRDGTFVTLNVIPASPVDIITGRDDSSTDTSVQTVDLPDLHRVRTKPRKISKKSPFMTKCTSSLERLKQEKNKEHNRNSKGKKRKLLQGLLEVKQKLNRESELESILPGCSASRPASVDHKPRVSEVDEKERLLQGLVQVKEKFNKKSQPASGRFRDSLSTTNNSSVTKVDTEQQLLEGLLQVKEKLNPRKLLDFDNFGTPVGAVSARNSSIIGDEKPEISENIVISESNKVKEQSSLWLNKIPLNKTVSQKETFHDQSSNINLTDILETQRATFCSSIDQPICPTTINLVNNSSASKALGRPFCIKHNTAKHQTTFIPLQNACDTNIPNPEPDTNQIVINTKRCCCKQYLNYAESPMVAVNHAREDSDWERINDTPMGTGHANAKVKCFLTTESLVQTAQNTNFKETLRRIKTSEKSIPALSPTDDFTYKARPMTNPYPKNVNNVRSEKHVASTQQDENRSCNFQDFMLFTGHDGKYWQHRLSQGDQFYRTEEKTQNIATNQNISLCSSEKNKCEDTKLENSGVPSRHLVSNLDNGDMVSSEILQKINNNCETSVGESSVSHSKEEDEEKRNINDIDNPKTVNMTSLQEQSSSFAVDFPEDSDVDTTLKCYNGVQDNDSSDYYVTSKNNMHADFGASQEIKPNHTIFFEQTKDQNLFETTKTDQGIEMSVESLRNAGTNVFDELTNSVTKRLIEDIYSLLSEEQTQRPVNIHTEKGERISAGDTILSGDHFCPSRKSKQESEWRDLTACHREGILISPSTRGFSSPNSEMQILPNSDDLDLSVLKQISEDDQPQTEAQGSCGKVQYMESQGFRTGGAVESQYFSSGLIATQEFDISDETDDSEIAESTVPISCGPPAIEKQPQEVQHTYQQYMDTSATVVEQVCRQENLEDGIAGDESLLSGYKEFTPPKLSAPVLENTHPTSELNKSVKTIQMVPCDAENAVLTGTEDEEQMSVVTHPDLVATATGDSDRILQVTVSPQDISDKTDSQHASDISLNCCDGVSGETVKTNQISENSQEAVGSGTSSTGILPWVSHKDPQTGRMMYINLATGNTTYEAHQLDMDPIDREVCNAVHLRKGLSLLSDNAIPFLTNTKLEKSYRLRVMDNKTGPQVASPADNTKLSFMLHGHMEQKDAEEHVKWQTGPFSRTNHDEDVNTDGMGLQKMFKDWENPTFIESEKTVTSLEATSATRIATRVHHTLHSQRFTREMLPSLQVLAQIDNKFIACLLNTDVPTANTEANMLVIIDQHAAHERVRLEDLIQEAYEDDIGSDKKRIKVANVQPPEQLILSQEHVRILNAYKEQVEKMGVRFTTTSDTRDTISVLGIPACLMAEGKANEQRQGRLSFPMDTVETLLKEQVDLLEKTHGACPVLSKAIHRVLCSQACHGAIRFGDALESSECDKLIRSLCKCQLPFQCAHGRPSIIPLLDLRLINRTFHTEEKKAPKLWKLRQRFQGPDIKCDS